MGLRGIGAVPLSKRLGAVAPQKRRKMTLVPPPEKRGPGRPRKAPPPPPPVKRGRGRPRKVVEVETWVAPWLAPDLKRWERVIAFLEDLSVTSGELAGTKMKIRDWQRKFIKRTYSNNAKGRREVRTAILTLARKNGKTFLAAGLALCHLCGPEAEPRGEVYSCANDRFQAGKLFAEMVALIQVHPYLKNRLNIIRFRKEIEDFETGSVYAALSSEAKTKFGLSPSFVIYDELGQAADRHLYDAMDSAMGARKEPLLLVISTQAADDNAPMSQLVDYGLKVNAGDIEDPTFHMTFYAASPDADPWSLQAWKAANPALGDFRSLSDVERQAMQAQRMPGQENSFRNLILNQRVAAYSKFIERSQWNECAGEVEIPLNAKVYGGLDLGSTRDMSSLVLIHQDIEGMFHVKPFFWLPGHVQERSDQDRAPYDLWERQGLLTAVGATTDPKLIALAIANLSADYRLMTLAFDRWRINDLQRELDEIGCEVALVPHGQGFKDMTPAVDIVERLVVQKRLRHGGNPVLSTCVANAVITRDPAGGRKLDKAKSTGRIDGLVALCMALSTALILPGPDEIDVRGMIG